MSLKKTTMFLKTQHTKLLREKYTLKCPPGFVSPSVIGFGVLCARELAFLFLTKSYLHRHCVIHSHKSEGLIFDSHRLTCWCIHLRCITRSTTTPHKTFYLHFLAACPHWNHHKRQEFRVTFAKHRREFTDIWDCLSSRNICMWFALQFVFCVVFFCVPTDGISTRNEQSKDIKRGQSSRFHSAPGRFMTDCDVSLEVIKNGSEL